MQGKAVVTDISTKFCNYNISHITSWSLRRMHTDQLMSSLSQNVLHLLTCLQHICHAWEHFWKSLSKSSFSTTITLLIQNETLSRFSVYETWKGHTRSNMVCILDVPTTAFFLWPKTAKSAARNGVMMQNPLVQPHNLCFLLWRNKHFKMWR
jgi:hypothetical protein